MKLYQNIKSLTKSNPLVMLFYVLIIGASGYLIINSRAATPSPPAPTIYLNEASQILPVNTTFTVEVRANSGTTAVNAVQANMSYPATLIDFVSINYASSAFPIQAQSSGAGGQIIIARGIDGSVTGDKLIGTITFKTKATTGTAGVVFTSGTALISSTNNNDILPSLSVTGGGNYIVDATAPTVSITSPTNGSVLTGGSTNNIAITAADNTAISGVDILIDGTLKATDTTSPYTYSWNTTGTALGTHTIQARARDNYGNSTLSSLITVTLADRTAPTASITSPTSGTKIIGTTSIVASAADNSGGTGINKVEFYVDGALKATDTTSPYTYSWDSKTVVDGSHSLTVKAYDNASPANVVTSSAVGVTVDNADHTPPSTPGNFKMSSNTLTSITLTWTSSTDNIGVTGYRIQRNGVVLTTTSLLTYTDNNLASGTSYNYSVTAIDSSSNLSTPASISASTKALKNGDINNDGKVDIVDLSAFLTNWGTTNATSDLNHNGLVDIYDLSILLTNYGT